VLLARMCDASREPKTLDSTVKEASGESAIPSSRRGAPSSALSKRPRDVDGETALEEACLALGRPALFEEADAQELRDLADSRNRTRGERTRNKRLKRCWAAVERARAVALSSSGAELAAAVDRVPERESLDGCAAGHSSWLGWHAPPALDLAQCGPIARQSA
jgi:hypothetical protein